MTDRTEQDAIDGFFKSLDCDFEERVNIVSNEHARLSLRRSLSGDAVYLMKINCDSHKRGQGFASDLLSLVCNAADEFEVTLFLEVEKQDDSGLSETDLASWYWRHGFRGKLDEMIRVPITQVPR